MNTRIYISLMSLCALISVSCAEKIVDERPIKNNGDVGFTTVIYQNPVSIIQNSKAQHFKTVI